DTAPTSRDLLTYSTRRGGSVFPASGATSQPWPPILLRERPRLPPIHPSPAAGLLPQEDMLRTTAEAAGGANRPSRRYGYGSTAPPVDPARRHGPTGPRPSGPDAEGHHR